MNKQIITFDANEQSLIKTGGVDKYSSNKVSYIEAHFNLGENWSGFDSVRAVWSTWYECISTALDTEGICIVPYEVLKRTEKVMVNLVGSISEDDVLTDRITTYPIKALEVDADAKVCGSNTQPITPSEYEQFVEAVKADADRAEEAKEDARGFASSAEISAQSASISETNASTSEDNAKVSELNAEAYKNQAQIYAQNANNSAISAENAKDEAEDARDTILGMRAEAATLPEGSSATASYSDGVLSLGIPRGDKGDKGDKGDRGDKGDKGDKGDRGDTGNGIESVELTSTVGSVKTYTITFTDGNTTAFEVTDGEVTNASLADTLKEYEKASELVDAMAVASVSDSAPYLFRPTADGKKVGSFEKDSIVGGTVAWNQQVSLAQIRETRTIQGVQFTNNNNGTITLSGTATGTVNAGEWKVLGLPTDHICIYTYIDVDSKLKWTMAKYPSNASDQGTIKIVSGNTYNITFYPQSFDLTQMFGSTIADYIYSLEQANAGAGVAWFKKLFPKDYYEYDAGTLKSVEGVSAHEMVGFNQWDEEWEVGEISTTNGENVSGSNIIRSKNFISVLPNTAYYFKTGNTAVNTYRHFYDADKNYIGYVLANTNSVLTTPANAHYMRFRLGTTYGATYKNDICINISHSGTRNGEYEPYELHSYPLDSDLTLRGIPKLDANNNLYYDGDVYEPDGTVTRRFGVIDLGTLNYRYDASTKTPRMFARFSANDNVKGVGYSAIANIFLAGYTPVKADRLSFVADVPYSVALDPNTPPYVILTADGVTDTATFKANMSGKYLVYELATPTTETATPYNEVQICNDWGTEEYVSTGIVPVGHNTEYPLTLKDTAPTTDGSYLLKATVSGGKPTLEWVSAE